MSAVDSGAFTSRERRSKVSIAWAVAVAASCAPVSPRQRLGRDERPPTIRLELSVRGQEIGFTANPVCDGRLRGAISILTPSGQIERMPVDVRSVGERCVGCLGSPESCRNACQPAYGEWVNLGGYPFVTPGDYMIQGDDLVLSCAPQGVHVATLSITVESPSAAPLATASPPAKPEPSETATELRSRLPRASSVLVGTLEGLVIPIESRDARSHLARTRWGQFPAFTASTSAVFVAGELGPYWLQRRDATGKIVPWTSGTQPEILALTIEDGTAEALKAGQSGGAVVVSSRRPAEVTLDVAAMLDDSLNRWRTFQAGQERALAEVLEIADRATPQRPHGQERISTETLFLPTWLEASQRLVVRFQHRTTRWSERTVVETACPKNRPGPCRQVPVKDRREYHADLAIALEYDRAGALIETRNYPATPLPRP